MHRTPTRGDRRVPCHDRDIRLDRLFADRNQRISIIRRDRQAVHVLSQQGVDQLNLLCGVGLRRALVGHSYAKFLRGLLGAVVGGIEIWVPKVLGQQDIVLATARGCRRGGSCWGGGGLRRGSGRGCGSWRGRRGGLRRGGRRGRGGSRWGGCGGRRGCRLSAAAGGQNGQ